MAEDNTSHTCFRVETVFLKPVIRQRSLDTLAPRGLGNKTKHTPQTER